MEILELKRDKRSRKTAVTRVRHALEKQYAKKGEINVEIIEKEIDGLWGVLEKCFAIIDELCYMYLQIGELDTNDAISKESDIFEVEILQAIEKAGVIKESIKAKQVQNSSVNVVATHPPSLNQ